MEGLSHIIYKDKTIIYVDYSGFGSSKEKIIALIKEATAEYKKHPFGSVLSLINIRSTMFDIDILNIMKNAKAETIPYEKKIAIIGMEGLQKAAYDFIVCLTQKGIIKAFQSSQEAKEWLIDYY
jgi:hypothetical protein